MSTEDEEDVFVPAPSREKMVSKARLRAIRRMAETAGEVKLHWLYEELYGATAGASLTVERMRASLREACDQLLEREAA